MPTLEYDISGGSSPPKPAPKPVAKPLSVVDNVEPVNVNATVPATGEKYYQWFSRRLEMLGAEAPRVGAHILLELASQPYTDKELTGLARSISSIYGYIPPYLAKELSSKRAQVFQQQQDQARSLYMSQPEPKVREDYTPEELAELSPEALAAIPKQADIGKAFVYGSLGEIVEQLDVPYKVVSKPVGAAGALVASTVTANPITPAEAWRRAMTMGPGRAIAESAGLQPGTKPYQGVSAGLDFMARWFADPTVIAGKISRGAKIARVLPGVEGAALAERSVITRAVYERLSKPPEVLIRDKVAQAGVDAMWATAQKGNANALIDRFRIPAEMAQDILGAGSRNEVEAITLDYLTGRARLAGGSAQRTILRQVPEDTFWGRWREEVKRGSLGQYTARFTEPNRILRRPFQGIPNHGISVANKDAGRVQLQRLAELFGFDQATVDRHVNAYLSAPTRDEVRRTVFDLLKEGRTKLPDSIGSEITQVYDDISQSIFYLADDGNKAWTKTRVAGGGRGTYVDALPHLETEVSWEVPLPNVERIRELTSMGGRIRTMIEDAAVRRGAPKAGLALTESWRDVNRLVSWYTAQVFKPLALIRVGWPVKIVGEEQARLAAFDVPSAYHSPLEFLKNVKLAKSLDIPEEAMTNVARSLIEGRSSRGVVRYGEKGFAEGWHGEVQQLRDSKVARRIAQKGEANTTDWLVNGEGRKILDDYQSILDEAGETVEGWVASIAKRIDEKAPTPRLREAIIKGYFKDDTGLKVHVDSDEFANHLRQAADVDAPLHVKNVYEDWRKVGNGYQRVVTRLLDVLGSKPTNALSRAPAWAHFYKSEKARLTKLLGKDSADLIERSSREYATGQVKRILFEIGERSAMHAAAKNSAPFLNAFQEVLERWTVAIPAEYGPLGHAYVIQRARAVAEFAKDLGVLEKDDEGKWIINVPGLEAVVGLVPGLEGIQVKIPLERLSIFGSFPFSGPVVQFPVATYIKATEKTNALFDLMLPYGPETTLGPVWMNRAWRATFGSAPPWERALPSAKYQETLWDAALVDWMRHDEAKNKTLSSLSKIANPEERAEAIEDWVENAKRNARGIFAVRAAFNFFSPASPQFYWKEEREMVAFRKKLLTLSEGDRKKAVDRLFEERPGLEGYFAAKSYRVKGEQPREYKQEEYWKDWRNGNIKRYKPEEWAEIASGYLAYSSIRRQARDDLSDIGTNASDWLKNASAYLKVNSDRREAQARLAKDNPKWQEAFKRVVENASKRDGKPLPGFEEQLALDFTANVKLLSSLLRGKEDVDVDWSALSRAKAQITDQFKLERFYSNRELADGPEKDIAWYWENVFGPYLDDVSARFKDAKFKPAEEQARIYESIRKLSNGQTPKTYNGQTFPTPEETLYYMQDGEQQHETRTKWALRPVSYLSNFQRKSLGLADSEQATQFWDAISDARAQATQYIRDKGWIPQQKEAKALRASLEEWEVAAAQRSGMIQEYALSEAVPYQRVRFFDQGVGQFWQAFYRNADEVGRVTATDGAGPFSKAGNPYRQALYSWLTQARTNDAGFDKDWRQLHELSRYKGAGSTDKFYDWYIFGVMRP